MSRVGNNPISVPEDVSIKINGNAIKISGKNGNHTHTYIKILKLILKIMS